MFTRHLKRPVLEALHDSPVVLLTGARQTGKSTLAREFVDGGYLDRYLTLDDLTVLAAARADPVGFLEGSGERIVIDEVQRVPDLFLAIKGRVDRRRAPGAYLLTGSANVMFLPRLSDALAGRMELHTLRPLTQGELEGRPERFLSMAFSRRRPRWRPVSIARDELLDRIVKGGYPEAVSRKSPGRRHAWFNSYLSTILQRDVRDLANVAGLTELPRLARLLASRSSGLLNHAGLSRDCALAQTTLKRYLALLQATFLTDLLPAWSTNIGKRLVKSPKIHLNDTGLACHLLGVDRLKAGHAQAGALVESFVLGELSRQASWADRPVSLFHFRTHTGQEVDIVLERGDGAVVGVEVKLGARAAEGDFKGLKTLREAAREQFRRGIVLYTGEKTVPFGKDLEAVPISCLWH